MVAVFDGLSGVIHPHQKAYIKPTFLKCELLGAGYPAVHEEGQIEALAQELLSPIMLILHAKAPGGSPESRMVGPEHGTADKQAPHQGPLSNRAQFQKAYHKPYQDLTPRLAGCQDTRDGQNLLGDTSISYWAICPGALSHDDRRLLSFPRTIRPPPNNAPGHLA